MVISLINASLLLNTVTRTVTRKGQGGRINLFHLFISFLKLILRAGNLDPNYAAIGPVWRHSMID